MRAQATDDHNASSRRWGALLSAALISILMPLIARAEQPTGPACDALVSVTNNLYLVTAAGAMVAQFTTDDTAKTYATVSPSGHRVAFVIPSSDDHEFNNYYVADRDGNQWSFPVDNQSRSLKDQTGVTSGDAGPLMELWWNSNDVLRLTQHVSPSVSVFQFRRVEERLTDQNRRVRVGFGAGCVMRKVGGAVACVQDTTVRVGNQSVFYDSGFPSTPIASFTLARGDSVTTVGSPSFTVKFVGLYRNEIGIDVTSAVAPAVGGTTYLPPGNHFLTLWRNSVQYGFSAHLVDPSTGRVQVEEFLGRSAGTSIFDSAIAWQPERSRLLLIHREGDQVGLYLIQPSEGQWNAGAQHNETGSSGNDQNGHPRGGKEHSWNLVAQAPIKIAGHIESMRFVAPSDLLLQGVDGTFSWVPVEIGAGTWRHHNQTLTVGAVTPLPSMITASINGSSLRTKVLDWACGGAGDGAWGR